MASAARRVVSLDEGDDISEAIIDYVGVSVPSTRTWVERCEKLKASQKTRRKHRAWMFLVEKGYQTPQEIAEDTGLTVQAIYYGIARAKKREVKIKAMGIRHGL
jgi:hypothetical protein